MNTNSCGSSSGLIRVCSCLFVVELHAHSYGTGFRPLTAMNAPRISTPRSPRGEPGPAPVARDTVRQLPERFSVVVPFFNEVDNVVPVLEELRRVLPEAEIIAVDDGSSDGTWERIQSVPGVRGLSLEHWGQSAAIYHGLRAATGELCGIMDGDGQNDPANFPVLLEAWARGEADVICGFRERRADRWNRRIASRVANGIRRWFLDDGVRDTGCSQKVFPRHAVELLVPFRGLHRYLPAIFKQAGLRIAEVPVRHRVRRAGASKYTNWSRALIGIHDLIGVGWLLKRKLPPLKPAAKS
jgi:dolichol-phosphate mannosyltransferase